MRFPERDLRAVPLPAAWLDAAGTVVAATPEWLGAGLGVRQYRAGRMRLLVATTSPSAGVGALSERLLQELDAAVPQTDRQRRAGVRLAVAALGVAIGQSRTETLTERQVAEAVVAAAELEDRAPVVHVEAAGAADVRGGWLVAAALKQILMNARKHEGCDEVWLRLAGDWSVVGWQGQAARGVVATSRHPDRRTGWGLGMVRLCCDALGAEYLAPAAAGDGRVEAAFVLQPESSSLRLPMATVRSDGFVEQATRTWDAETRTLPGRVLREPELLQLVASAMEASGRIVSQGPWAARRHGEAVWIALRPADTSEQARDLLQGLDHEAQLLVGDRRSVGWRRALAVLETLQLVLGRPLQGYGSVEFTQDVRAYGDAFGLDLGELLPATEPAPPPALVAFILAAGGGGEMKHGDGAWLLRPRHPSAPELASLVGAEGMIRLELVDTPVGVGTDSVAGSPGWPAARG